MALTALTGGMSSTQQASSAAPSLPISSPTSSSKTDANKLPSLADLMQESSLLLARLGSSQPDGMPSAAPLQSPTESMSQQLALSQLAEMSRSLAQAARPAAEADPVAERALA